MHTLLSIKTSYFLNSSVYTNMKLSRSHCLWYVTVRSGVLMAMHAVNQLLQD